MTHEDITKFIKSQRIDKAMKAIKKMKEKPQFFSFTMFEFEPGMYNVTMNNTYTNGALLSGSIQGLLLSNPWPIPIFTNAGLNAARRMGMKPVHKLFPEAEEMGN